MSREQEILDAAVRLFHERGYAAVGVDDIGADVGISGPAIYRHFSGKSDLLVRLVEGALDRFYAQLSTPADDPWAELEEIARVHVSVCLQAPEQTSLIVREWKEIPEEVRRRIRRRTVRYLERWATAVSACYPAASPKDVELAVNAAIGMLNSVIHWHPDAQRPRGTEEVLTRACLDALSALGASSGSVAPAAVRQSR